MSLGRSNKKRKRDISENEIGSIDTLLDSALSHYDRQEYKQAAKDYKKVLGIDDEEYMALYGYGLTCYDLGKYERSLKYLNKALDQKPEDSAILNDKGVALETLGYNDEALQSYNDSIHFSDANYNRIDLLKNLSKEIVDRPQQVEEELTHENETLRDQLNQVEEELNKKEESLTQLKKELTAANEKTQLCEEANTLLQVNITSLEEEVFMAHDLQTQLMHDTQLYKQQLQSNVEEMILVKSLLIVQQDLKADAQKDLIEQVNHFKQKEYTKTVENLRLQTVIADLENEIKITTENKNQFQKEISDLKQQAQLTINKNKELQDRINHLNLIEIENSDFRIKVASLEKEIDAKNEVQAQLTKEIDDLKNKNESLNEENDSFNETMRDLKENLYSTRHENEHLINTNTENERLINTLNDAQSALQLRIASLDQNAKINADAALTEISNFKKQIKLLDKQKQDLENKVLESSENHKAEVLRLEVEKVQLENRVRDLEQQSTRRKRPTIVNTKNNAIINQAYLRAAKIPNSSGPNVKNSTSQPSSIYQPLIFSTQQTQLSRTPSPAPTFFAKNSSGMLRIASPENITAGNFLESILTEADPALPIQQSEYSNTRQTEINRYSFTGCVSNQSPSHESDSSEESQDILMSPFEFTRS